MGLSETNAPALPSTAVQVGLNVAFWSVCAYTVFGIAWYLRRRDVAVVHARNPWAVVAILCLMWLSGFIDDYTTVLVDPLVYCAQPWLLAVSSGSVIGLFTLALWRLLQLIVKHEQQQQRLELYHFQEMLRAREHRRHARDAAAAAAAAAAPAVPATAGAAAAAVPSAPNPNGTAPSSGAPAPAGPSPVAAGGGTGSEPNDDSPALTGPAPSTSAGTPPVRPIDAETGAGGSGSGTNTPKSHGTRLASPQQTTAGGGGSMPLSRRSQMTVTADSVPPRVNGITTAAWAAAPGTTSSPPPPLHRPLSNGAPTHTLRHAPSSGRDTGTEPTARASGTATTGLATATATSRMTTTTVTGGAPSPHGVSTVVAGGTGGVVFPPVPVPPGLNVVPTSHGRLRGIGQGGSGADMPSTPPEMSRSEAKPDKEQRPAPPQQQPQQAQERQKLLRDVDSRSVSTRAVVSAHVSASGHNNNHNHNGGGGGGGGNAISSVTPMSRTPSHDDEPRTWLARHLNTRSGRGFALALVLLTLVPPAVRLGGLHESGELTHMTPDTATSTCRLTDPVARYCVVVCAFLMGLLALRARQIHESFFITFELKWSGVVAVAYAVFGTLVTELWPRFQYSPLWMIVVIGFEVTIATLSLYLPIWLSYRAPAAPITLLPAAGAYALTIDDGVAAGSDDTATSSAPTTGGTPDPPPPLPLPGAVTATNAVPGTVAVGVPLDTATDLKTADANGTGATSAAAITATGAVPVASAPSGGRTADGTMVVQAVSGDDGVAGLWHSDTVLQTASPPQPHATLGAGGGGQRPSHATQSRRHHSNHHPHHHSSNAHSNNPHHPSHAHYYQSHPATGMRLMSIPAGGGGKSSGGSRDAHHHHHHHGAGNHHGGAGGGVPPHPHPHSHHQYGMGLMPGLSSAALPNDWSSLERVLAFGSTRDAFSAYLMSEFALEMLLFIDAVVALHEMLPPPLPFASRGSSRDAQAQAQAQAAQAQPQSQTRPEVLLVRVRARAIEIYERFVMSGAAHEVKLRPATAFALHREFKHVATLTSASPYKKTLLPSPPSPNTLGLPAPAAPGQRRDRGRSAGGGRESSPPRRTATTTAGGAQQRAGSNGSGSPVQRVMATPPQLPVPAPSSMVVVELQQSVPSPPQVHTTLLPPSALHNNNSSSAGNSGGLSPPFSAGSGHASPPTLLRPSSLSSSPPSHGASSRSTPEFWAHVFDRARTEVFVRLETDALPRFLATDAFHAAVTRIQAQAAAMAQHAEAARHREYAAAAARSGLTPPMPAVNATAATALSHNTRGSPVAPSTRLFAGPAHTPTPSQLSDAFAAGRSASATGTPAAGSAAATAPHLQPQLQQSLSPTAPMRAATDAFGRPLTVVPRSSAGVPPITLIRHHSSSANDRASPHGGAAGAGAGGGGGGSSSPGSATPHGGPTPPHGSTPPTTAPPAAAAGTGVKRAPFVALSWLGSSAGAASIPSARQVAANYAGPPRRPVSVSTSPLMSPVDSAVHTPVGGGFGGPGSGGGFGSLSGHATPVGAGGGSLLLGRATGSLRMPKRASAASSAGGGPETGSLAGTTRASLPATATTDALPDGTLESPAVASTGNHTGGAGASHSGSKSKPTSAGSPPLTSTNAPAVASDASDTTPASSSAAASGAASATLAAAASGSAAAVVAATVAAQTHAHAPAAVVQARRASATAAAATTLAPPLLEPVSGGSDIAQLSASPTTAVMASLMASLNGTAHGTTGAAPAAAVPAVVGGFAAVHTTAPHVFVHVDSAHAPTHVPAPSLDAAAGAALAAPLLLAQPHPHPHPHQQQVLVHAPIMSAAATAAETASERALAAVALARKSAVEPLPLLGSGRAGGSARGTSHLAVPGAAAAAGADGVNVVPSVSGPRGSGSHTLMPPAPPLSLGLLSEDNTSSGSSGAVDGSSPAAAAAIDPRSSVSMPPTQNTSSRSRSRSSAVSGVGSSAPTTAVATVAVTPTRNSEAAAALAELVPALTLPELPAAASGVWVDKPHAKGGKKHSLPFAYTNAGGAAAAAAAVVAAAAAAATAAAAAAASAGPTGSTTTVAPIAVIPVRTAQSQSQPGAFPYRVTMSGASGAGPAS